MQPMSAQQALRCQELRCRSLRRRFEQQRDGLLALAKLRSDSRAPVARQTTKIGPPDGAQQIVDPLSFLSIAPLRCQDAEQAHVAEVVGVPSRQRLRQLPRRLLLA